ncbi:MAG: tail fiber domain-containing protein, partial [Chthoniobacterales bacterium]
GSFVWSGDSSEDTRSFGDNTFTVRAEGGVRFYTANGTGIGAFLGPGGSWQVASDSNLKTKVTAVDPRVILSKVAAMPVMEWEYKALPNRRYIGPMAQDFHAIFGLGYDDKSISTLDSDGVMYAAIQGLVEELRDRDKEIAELKTKSAEVDDMKAKLESVEERLNSLLPPAATP